MIKQCKLMHLVNWCIDKIMITKLPDRSIKNLLKFIEYVDHFSFHFISFWFLISFSKREYGKKKQNKQHTQQKKPPTTTHWHKFEAIFHWNEIDVRVKQNNYAFVMSYGIGRIKSAS